MNGMGGIGRRLPGEAQVAPGAVEAGDGLEGLAPAGPGDADAAEALDELATVSGAVLARLAGRPRTVDDVLAGPGREHLARGLEPGRAMAALTRFVRRGPRAGESAQERKLRELVARLLDLRQEATTAMGVVQVG